jgi:acetylornithine deacetylase/succinyl-diaminopimelate desuccinylase-like protein
MKAGLAAAVEALRILRETRLLSAGSILLTAHDLHEAPWGLGLQLNQLIADGYVGDGVLLPEPFGEVLPIIGRGAAIWRATIRRPGAATHEVMRPGTEPSVIAAGADLIATLEEWNRRLAQRLHPLAGCESVFIGQIHAGEIYNQFPAQCDMEGTRRWLPSATGAEVEAEFHGVLQKVAQQTGTMIEAEFIVIRDAFQMKTEAFVWAFHDSDYFLRGERLPLGAKPFVDDGNSFWALARVPAITHGPRAGGQHTLNEWVSINDLVRVAQLYALTTVVFCGSTHSERD